MIQTVARAARCAAAVIREPTYVRPGHFYSPVPSRADVEEVLLRNHPVDPAGVDLREADQLSLAKKLGPMWRDTPLDGRYTVGENRMFPLSDAAVYSALLRTEPPARVVEVGSGYSSAIALDTADRWGIDIEFTFIEPYPQRLLDLLSTDDDRRVMLRRERVQDTPQDVFDELSGGDILFIDSTHVMKAGSDVGHLVFNVLPRLHRGVRVHFHDVFWPFEYPEEWLRERRGWNETYLLHAFLAFNGAYEIDLFNDWLWRVNPDVPRCYLPESAAERPGGLWLRRK